MTPAATPAPDPRDFPTTTLSASTTAYRIFQPRDPVTGDLRHPWFFSSTPAPAGSKAGRFDLPAPEGSCYSSDQRHGAWLEVFRDTGMVDRADVDARRILHATRTASLSLANLTAREARPYGVTVDIGAGDDYTMPQALAALLHEQSFKGLFARVRHDPEGQSRTIVEFGPAGAQETLAGWDVEQKRITDDRELLETLADYGTGIAPVPTSVTVIPPPPSRATPPAP